MQKSPIFYKARSTKKTEEEKVYGGKFLFLLYKNPLFSFLFLPLIAKISFFSKWYGSLQRKKQSRKKIIPFIREFGVNMEDFAKKPEEFDSFHDFFIRKLRKGARPICPDPKKAVLCADGRYLFYPKMQKGQIFQIKGTTYSLSSFLQDAALAKRYEEGSMVVARLCPSDYHRFHFPCSGIPKKSRRIEGDLYSVNPIALSSKIAVFTKNKREITLIETDLFKEIAFVEVGATYVGSIFQTYTPHKPCKKGEEKGFFTFGASCIVLLFQKNTISFDEDLLELSQKEMEVKANMGESMGVSLS